MHNEIKVMEEAGQCPLCTYQNVNALKAWKDLLILFVLAKITFSWHNLNFDLSTADTIEPKSFYPVQEGLI